MKIYWKFLYIFKNLFLKILTCFHICCYCLEMPFFRLVWDKVYTYGSFYNIFIRQQSLNSFLIYFYCGFFNCLFSTDGLVWIKMVYVIIFESFIYNCI